MPSTRTGRQSSPSKRDESPSKTRFQPMRGARLRSASPFFDTASALTSAAESQALQSSQTSSPSKSARSSPRKKVAAATASLQPPRRSTRSRSRSVDPESLSAIEEHSSSPLNRDVSEMPDSEKEVAQSNSVRLDSAYTNNDERNASPEPQLAPIFEEATYTSASLAATEAESDEGAPSSSSSSSSESDSDSGASSDSDDSSSEFSSEDEQEDDPATDLDALLKASQQAYKSRAPAPADQSRFEDNQDVISFDALTDGLQSSKRPSKAIPLVVKAKHQVAKTQPAASKGQGSSKDKLDKQIEALDQGALASEKKSKHARTVQTSTGSSWFDMPEFGASASRLAALKKQSTADKGHSKATGGDARLASAEQLRREVQALRLRNALDPKRFYRSSAKNQAMPKFAQLGKIIASPLEPKAVMSRQERGRTVVEELIRDADAASYAKRKFSESQASHRSNYNGRRKPPSKKKRT